MIGAFVFLYYWIVVYSRYGIIKDDEGKRNGRGVVAEGANGHGANGTGANGHGAIGQRASNGHPPATAAFAMRQMSVHELFESHGL